MPTTRQLKFVAKRPINVSLVVLDCWCIRHDSTSQRFTPFWPLTVTSQQWAIWRRPFMHSAISILHHTTTTMASLSLPIRWLRCKVMYTFLLRLMLKLIQMLSHQHLQPCQLFHPTALAGDLKLEVPLRTGPFFHFSSFGVWAAASSFGMADLLAGSGSAKTLHLSAHVKLKYTPLMQPRKRLLTFAISVPVCVKMAILFLILHSQLFSTTIMMLASNDHTTWPQKLHVTLSFLKTQSVNGSKTNLLPSSTSQARLTLRTHSKKKCMMLRTFSVYWNHSCLDYLTFFKILSCSGSIIHRYLFLLYRSCFFLFL